MSIGRQTDAEKVKPLAGAIKRRRQLGATTEAGELVSMQDDGKCDPANETSSLMTIDGVALQDGVDGDWIDIVTHGPVECLTGATPGAIIYASNTAGEPDESAGTNVAIAGKAESATVLYVNPYHYVDTTG